MLFLQYDESPVHHQNISFSYALMNETKFRQVA
jgi:hypothetical protein